MKKHTLVSLLCLALAGSFPAIATAAADNAAYAGNFAAKFDPTRDATHDLADAIAKAKTQNKRVIVDVGGEWCVWCLRMDKFMQGNAQIMEAVNANYVWVKVNYSDENKNQTVLSSFPKIKGYPHLFVLDKNGALLQSQSTGAFEQDKSYNAENILSFLHQWAPH